MIKIDKERQAVIIKDGMKTQHQLMIFILVLTLSNAALNLVNLLQEPISFMSGIWLVLGSVSLIFLYILICKRTTKEEIPISQIVQFQSNAFLGNSKYLLALKNGKKRQLNAKISQSEIETLKRLVKHQN